MANYDGEYELRIYYVTYVNGVPLEHRHTHDVQPINPPAVGSDFTEIPLVSKSGGADPLLSEHTDAIVEFMKDMYHSTTTIVRAELWAYAGASLNAGFIAVYPIGEVGDAVATTVAAQQLTVTFRSQAGYTLRMQFMEPAIGGDIKDPYPFANLAATALADYVVGQLSPVKARDNTFAVVALNACYGANEKLWRKRFRST
jgi:hypothetical protein